MAKLITPEQEFENPNAFYTQQEVKRYENNSGMKRSQITLTKIALSISGINLNNKKIFILDVGCGTGFSLEYLKDLGFINLKGIDPSLEMIKIAKDKGFLVEDLGFEDLNKIKNKFDLIISISALQWVIANKRELLLKNLIKKIGKGLYNLLNVNGKAVIQFYPESEIVFKDISSSFNRCGFSVQEYIYNSDSLKKRKYFLILFK
ncbi:MAG: methyltransferase domain-containing protein [archaeon]|jgi:SAM-dependent methyltransferase|nr:methyltransferase domain-containing protein [archaeon]MDD2477484.1 methyltransferase domain-containing protein [Candidatus ainarchaeum sp.]MDD3084772.1 methyltransferase domain-containing protein [Candidatus ainarchaeum sp.]MDD4221448.1 methyltransferase domain-containing protein [Candidatus ainarchaeum sp.]MDD4662412.1 methyltransferase domain-containing protein [Candidatus ainarchaeum sp.]